MRLVQSFEVKNTPETNLHTGNNDFVPKSLDLFVKFLALSSIKHSLSKKSFIKNETEPVSTNMRNSSAFKILKKSSDHTMLKMRKKKEFF